MYGGVIGAPSLFYAPPPGALTILSLTLKSKELTSHYTQYTLSLCQLVKMIYIELFVVRV